MHVRTLKPICIIQTPNQTCTHNFTHTHRTRPLNVDSEHRPGSKARSKLAIMTQYDLRKKKKTVTFFFNINGPGAHTARWWTQHVGRSTRASCPCFSVRGKRKGATHRHACAAGWTAQAVCTNQFRRHLLNSNRQRWKSSTSTSASARNSVGRPNSPTLLQIFPSKSCPTPR